MAKKEKNKKKKKKTETKNITLKTRKIKIVQYIIITIILTITVYFVTTFITKKIMDVITKPKESDGVHNIFENLDTIESMTVGDFIKKLNINLKKNDLSYQLPTKLQDHDNAYLYTLDEEKGITLYIEPTKILKDPNKEILQLTALFVSNESENDEMISRLLRVLLYTNEEDLTDTNIEQLIENMNSTENATEEDGVMTSQFLQYKGLEVSKQVDQVESSYRIGRMMKND